jgi:hypothetical protein
LERWLENRLSLCRLAALEQAACEQPANGHQVDLFAVVATIALEYMRQLIRGGCGLEQRVENSSLRKHASCLPTRLLCQPTGQIRGIEQGRSFGPGREQCIKCFGVIPIPVTRGTESIDRRSSLTATKQAFSKKKQVLCLHVRDSEPSINQLGAFVVSVAR